MHVLCVGDLMIDVVAQLPGPLAVGSDTPAPVTITGGGAGANVAAWLVTAGARATFLGRVGDDPLGRLAVAELETHGVTTLMGFDPARPTGTCVVLVDPGGERTMIPSAGANGGDGDASGLLDVGEDGTDLLYVSGYTLLNASSRALGVEALRIARERGWPIAVDAASAAPLAALPEFLDLVGRDVLLFANSAEARVLTELDDAGAAAQSLALRCGQAVVKRGASGAVWSDGSGVWAVAALDVDVLDSTGAGDAFAAGFIAAHLAGSAPGDALRAGTELAGQAIVRPGARPAARSV